MFERAKEFFDRVRHGHEKAWLLESVLAECICVLTKIYKVPRGEAASALIALLQYKGIKNSDRDDLIYALQLYSEQGLDIVDAILCAKTTSGRYTLITFGKRLQDITKERPSV